MSKRDLEGYKSLYADTLDAIRARLRRHDRQRMRYGYSVASVFRTPEQAAAYAPDEPRYLSHFVTCPDAATWRKGRR